MIKHIKIISLLATITLNAGYLSSQERPQATNQTQTMTDQEIEQKAVYLFNEFASSDNTTIGWKCFAKTLAELLDKSPRYRLMSYDLRQLSDATNKIYIALKLRGYRSELPAALEGQFKKYNTAALNQVFNNGLKLNEKPCPTGLLTPERTV